MVILEGASSRDLCPGGWSLKYQQEIDLMLEGHRGVRIYNNKSLEQKD